MQGSLISSVLIFLVLFVGYVWEQVRLYWSMRQAELQHERERPPVLRQPQVIGIISSAKIPLIALGTASLDNAVNQMP